MTEHYDLYPIAIIEDRYSGVYSGGRWVAIARWEDSAAREARQDEYISRLRFVQNGAYGDDGDAMEFWGFTLEGGHEPPFPWLAVGETPNHALDALLAKRFAQVNGMTREEAAAGESVHVMSERRASE